MFGGPAAHIAVMQDEVVTRRRWLTRGEFLDLLGATNLIPGPNSTELAIHVGHARRGVPGLAVAGASFILPAMCIVTACAWAYVRYGTLPATGGLLYGIKPVVIAIVVQALWALGRTAIKTRFLAVVGCAAAVASFAGVNELAVLGVAALVVIASRAPARSGMPALFLAGVPASVTSFGLWPLFLVFLKIGSVLFGSGYVLLAFLRADLVERLHWISSQQLLDAVAVGQITPGPVFTTATFIGYVLGGVAGAGIATLGIFLPAFVFVGLSGPLVPRMRRSPLAGAALDGVNVASLALMAVVTWHLGRAALIDPLTIGLAVAAAVAILRFRVNSSWLILAAAAVGLLVGV